MKDLTKGNPTRLLLMFAIPMLLGNIFQQFYNLADTRIVGQYLGENPLAAVGATSSINNVIIGFMHGLTGGFSLTAARAFGEKNTEKLKQTVAATVVLGGVACIVLTILSLLFIDPLLHAINVEPDIYKDKGSCADSLRRCFRGQKQLYIGRMPHRRQGGKLRNITRCCHRRRRRG